MKNTIYLFFISICLTSTAQNLQTVKTYYDPWNRAQLKEIYTVIVNTPTKHDSYKLYDQRGTLLADFRFFNGVLDGQQKEYYTLTYAEIFDNARDWYGNIKEVNNYSKGILHGLTEKYDYSNGKKRISNQQVYDNGTLIKFTTFYPNGQKKLIEQKNGECIGYYESGKKSYRYFVKNGIKEGLYEGWYETGEIQLKGQFEKDKKSGEWIEYEKDGTIKLIEVFESGKKLPSEEELLAEAKRKKEEEERLKERELIEQQRAKEREQERELKKLEILKEKKESDINRIMRDYDIEKQVIIQKYTYWNGSRYAYKKKRLFEYYKTISDYIEEYIKNKENRNDNKIEMAKAGLRITLNMNSFLNGNTRELEKALKNAKSKEEMIELLKSKK